MAPRTLVATLTSTLVLGSLVVAAGSAVAAPAHPVAQAPAAAPVAPYTAMSLRAPDLQFVPSGGAFSSQDVTVTPWVDGGYQIDSGEHSVNLVAPAGETFHVGTYTTGGLLEPVVAYASVGEPGRGCTYEADQLVIHEFVVEAGVLTTLAADVSGDCGTAQIRYNATRPWTGLSVEPKHDFGQVEVGRDTTSEVTVTAAGTTSTTFGAAKTGPIDLFTELAPGGADFRVVADGCKGKTLAPGEACTIGVQFAPTGIYQRRARLVVPDNTPITRTTLEVIGEGTEDGTGTFYGLSTPTRFLDTRTSGTKRPLAKSSTTSLKITGRAGIPTKGVSAVALNLTAVATTSKGYFTVFPSGQSRPTASSINFPKGWTGANMVTVPVGADGKVALYNYGGAAHAVVDVLGWYAADDTAHQATTTMGGVFLPTRPTRMYDSRVSGGRFRNGDSVDFFDDWGDEDNTRIRQYVVNITAVSATRPGVLTAWRGVGSRPRASTVNYEPGVISPNMALVPAHHYDNGQVGFRISNTGSGTVHIVVDVVGLYLVEQLGGYRYRPLAPTRVLDTRERVGLSGAFGSNRTRVLNPGPVVGPYGGFLVANTTGILPTRQTYLTVWGGGTRPKTSNLNVNPGLVRSISTYADARDGDVSIYNYAGSTHVVMDVAGRLEPYPVEAPAAAGAAARDSDSATSRAAATAAQRVPSPDRPTVPRRS